MSLLRSLTIAGAMALVSIVACSSSDDSGQKVTLTGDALQDPNNCLPCHADQFKQWSGSMHAYASEDPVFIAMNKRMNRETNGANKDFCINCHAPLATRLGLTTDGSNLSTLPTSVRGITCFYCHTVDQVTDDHNNALHLAGDSTMRGAITNPAKSMPHKAMYSTLHDRENDDSAKMCGSCHDVLTPHGAKVERTFDEWKASLYSQPNQLSCGKCHMDGYDGKAAQVGADVPVRRIHDHSMAAVDTALTNFFGSDTQKGLVQTLLDNTILTTLCVQQQPTGIIATVTIDNAFAGHGFPSGASQDRRVWLELIAKKGDQVIFSTGTVPDKTAASTYTDPNYWAFFDKMTKEDGTPTHLFWEAAAVVPNQLPPAVTSNQQDPAFIHSKTQTFQLPSVPDTVSTRVRMRPLDYDLLDDLVQSGDLDPTVRDASPTIDLASGAKTWTPTIGFTTCVK